MEFFKHIWHNEQIEDCKTSFSYKVEEGAFSGKVPQNMQEEGNIWHALQFHAKAK